MLPCFWKLPPLQVPVGDGYMRVEALSPLILQADRFFQMMKKAGLQCFKLLVFNNIHKYHPGFKAIETTQLQLEGLLYLGKFIQCLFQGFQLLHRPGEGRY